MANKIPLIVSQIDAQIQELTLGDNLDLGGGEIVNVSGITTSNLVITGNVTANYFIGDGSQLVNLPAGNYSNANVAAYLPTYIGNLQVNEITALGPISSDGVTSISNISAPYFIGDGSQLTNLPAGNYGNSNVSAYLASGNDTAGYGTAGDVVGNTLVGSTINSLGDGYFGGNITAGNIIPTVDNTYFLGNATNRWANIWLGPGTIYMTDTANTANTAQLTVTNGILQVNGAAGLQSNLISGNSTLTISNSGPILMSIGGTANVLTVNSGNISVLGDANVSGNITTDSYFIGDGSQLTGIAPTVQVYEFANIVSTGGYYEAVWLADYTPGNIASISATVSTTATLLGAFITQVYYPNITVIPVGVISVRVETTKASGNRNYTVYAAIYSRTTGGIETLIATTDFSASSSLNTPVQQDLRSYINTPISLAATDRIVVKIYASVNQSTATIAMNFDDNSGAGLQLPALPASISTFVPYTGAIANLDLGSYSLLSNSNISVTGNTSSGNFIGNGQYLSNITGANVSGTVANATTASNVAVGGITGLGANVATFLATPTSTNFASAITGETGSGNIVFDTSPTLVTPALGTPSSGTLSSCTVDGTNAVGFREIPQNAQNTSYTLVLSDDGKHIYNASGASITYTIPANSSVAYPIGTAVSFINMAATALSIAITSDVMYLGGTGTTGTRTLAQYGSATALKITSTSWIITGSGLT